MQLLKYFLLVLCGTAAMKSTAQPIQEKHVNGNPKFEGRYSIAAKKQILPYIVSERADILQLAEMPPSAVFEGPCIFYAPNGQKIMEGT